LRTILSGSSALSVLTFFHGMLTRPVAVASNSKVSSVMYKILPVSTSPLVSHSLSASAGDEHKQAAIRTEYLTVNEHPWQSVAAF
jgi:hypothetical protein